VNLKIVALTTFASVLAGGKVVRVDAAELDARLEDVLADYVSH